MHVLDATLRETCPLLEPTATLPRLRSYSTPVCGFVFSGVVSGVTGGAETRKYVECYG